jgi:hypothetical protein
VISVIGLASERRSARNSSTSARRHRDRCVACFAVWQNKPVVIGDFKLEHNHRHSALGYLTPAETTRCRHQHHPVTCEIN